MKNTLYRTIAVLILCLPTAISAESSGNRQCAALFDDIWHLVAAASQCTEGEAAHRYSKAAVALWERAERQCELYTRIIDGAGNDFLDHPIPSTVIPFGFTSGGEDEPDAAVVRNYCRNHSGTAASIFRRLDKPALEKDYLAAVQRFHQTDPNRPAAGTQCTALISDMVYLEWAALGQCEITGIDKEKVYPGDLNFLTSRMQNKASGLCGTDFMNAPDTAETLAALPLYVSYLFRSTLQVLPKGTVSYYCRTYGPEAEKIFRRRLPEYEEYENGYK